MQLIFDCHNRDYKKEYREGYLHSLHWLNYRYKQLQRFHCCVYCWFYHHQIVTRRDVHHVTYSRRNHELDDDTVVICRATHDLVEQGAIPLSDLIEAREAYKKTFPE